MQEYLDRHAFVARIKTLKWFDLVNNNEIN